jgi:AcrR family transcriptional regulator
MDEPRVSTSPRQRRRAHTRRAILDAALKLIAEQGAAQLSLRELARRVDYSPAGLYEYFDGHQGVLEALAQEGDAALDALLAEVPADLPPGERLVAYGLAYVRFARTHPQHFDVMFNVLATRRTALADPVRPEAPYARVVAAVRAGVKQGLFHARPGFGPEAMAYGLWSLAHGAASLQLTKLRRHAEDFSAPDRAMLETFVAGLKSGGQRKRAR